MRKLMELGRSMVEMLGVLAIIGVLSIVGISGYRKAMLRHYANEAWDLIAKFRNDVLERATLNPNEKCNDSASVATWYCSAQKNAPGTANYSAKYCYMDKSDLIPAFAKNGYADFYMFVNPTATIAQWRNISINNLCTTILPNSHLVTPSSGAPYYSESIGNVEYRCFRKGESVEW